MNLYFDTNANRYFLIPEDQPISGGTFLLQTMDGETYHVSEDEVLPFEVNENDARRHFHDVYGAAIKNDIMQRISEALNIQPNPESEALAEQVFNPSPEQVAQNPERLIEELQSLLIAFAEILEGTTSNRAQRRAIAEEHLTGIRQMALEQGVPLDESFETLPDMLNQLYTKEQKAKLHKYAAKLRESAKMLDASNPQLNLDWVVAFMEHEFEGFLNLKQERAAEDEAKQREYRQHADDAIARSLKLHGFKVDQDE